MRRGRDVNPASSTASVQCRKAQTYDPGRDKGRSQPGRKTTKRNAMARGQSIRKRGRQGHRNTKAIAGCNRIRLSGRQVHANDRILEERGGGQRVHPVTRLGKSPRNCTQGKDEAWTRRSQGNRQNDRHGDVRNVAQKNRKHRPELQSHMANWRRPTRSV